jgi:antitoxin Phd
VKGAHAADHTRSVYDSYESYDWGMTAQPVPENPREPQEMPISDARDELASVVSRAHYNGRITYLTRRGQRLAAIVPAELAEAIERAEDEADIAAAREALARIDAGETPVPFAELRAELNL